MSDLRVVATILAKQGSEDTVRDGLAALVLESRKESGNLSYELFESSAEPGTFITIELWKSKADLDAHMETPHLQAALGTFGEHLSAPPAIHPLAQIV